MDAAGTAGGTIGTALVPFRHPRRRRRAVSLGPRSADGLAELLQHARARPCVHIGQPREMFGEPGGLLRFEARKQGRRSLRAECEQDKGGLIRAAENGRNLTGHPHPLVARAEAGPRVPHQIVAFHRFEKF